MHNSFIRDSIALSIHHHTRRRRAVILLVVLGMLALFSLLVATYIIFTSRSRKASFAIGRRETRSIDAPKLMDLAIGQVIYGSANANSSLMGHSLLEDLYGTDRIDAKVMDANNPLIQGPEFGPEAMYGRVDANIRRPQFLKFPVNLGNDPNNPAPRPYDVHDALTGRFVTFSEGPLRGLPFEVMRSFASKRNTAPDVANQFSLVVDAKPHFDRQVELPDGTRRPLRDLLSSSASVLRQFFYTNSTGYPLHISPRPRNGHGYGWSNRPSGHNLEENFSPRKDRFGAPAGADNDAFADASVPVIFQGNFPLLRPVGTGPGGATDESFDVADYHDYLLGYFPPNADANRVGITAPSGIRPAMLNYLLHYYGSDPASWSIRERLSVLRMLQRASLRPIPVTGGNAALDATDGRYATFTGSNNAANDALRRPINIDFLRQDSAVGVAEARRLASVYNLLIYGPWDVDNDGDGVADSVWIDAGLPLTTAPDGTLVRPMLALRVEDLDNRVDVNVTDSAASVETSGNTVSNKTRPNSIGSGPFPPFPGTPQSEMYSGFGFGPAEIVFTSFLRGSRGAQLITSRYGTDRTPGVPPGMVAANPIFPGDDTRSVWGRFGRTARHNLSLFEPRDANGNSLGQQPFPRSLFGMPIDTHGRSLLAADYYGQPMLNTAMSGGVQLPRNSGVADDVVSNPYQILYNAHDGTDNPFTIGELEGVLRYRDWDRDQHAAALRQLLEAELHSDERVSGSSRPNRDAEIERGSLTRAVTTVSATSASPGQTLPVHYAQSSDVNQSFNPVTRLALALLVDRNNGESLSDPKFDVLIPPELRRGERLDLNRPFGNGEHYDDVEEPVTARVPPLGDLTVDDPAELMGRTEAIFATPAGNSYQTLGDFTPQASEVPAATNPNPFRNEALRNELSRTELARHLYVMAYILISDTSDINALAGYDFRAGTTADANDVRARKLAQWAVNVVDFRDRDAIMTRFEYDPEPLDGWDEDPLQDGEPGPSGPWPFVWGCEQPELLLTESFNFHDRGVRDTARDDGGADKRFEGDNFADEDMDQVRIPQGTTFLELYCPRGPKAFGTDSDMHQTPPPELYSLLSRRQLYGNEANANDNDLVPLLDLGRLAPDGNPVWRIGISDIQREIVDNTMSPTTSPQSLLESMDADMWDTLTLQPEHEDFDITKPKQSNFRFDRIIWFANQDPRTVGLKVPKDSRVTGDFNQPIGNEHHKIYFNRFAPADYRGGAAIGLEGGQYAMVGPRRRTYVGSMGYEDAGPLSFDDYVPKQHFDLHPYSQGTGGFQSYVPSDNGNAVESKLITPAPRASAREVVPILAAATPPADWSNAAETAPTGIGINISEPIPLAGRYYTEPTEYMDSGEPTDVLKIDGYAKDTYYDYETRQGSYPDEPFDSRSWAPLNGFEATGTNTDFRTAYLQRLADPTREFDPNLNPYITVDWMSLDLTVFNGEDNDDREVGPDSNGQTQPVDLSDPEPYGDDLDEEFATRAKNGIGVNPDGTTRFSQIDNIIWSYGTQAPVASGRMNHVTYKPYFDHVLVHRADPNDAYVPPSYPNMDPPAVMVNYGNANVTENSQSLGFLNHTFGRRTSMNGADITNEMWEGAPSLQPFPWITFLNRDFASPYELMLVPASSAGRLMLEYSHKTAGTDPYKAKANGTASDATLEPDFGHLLNFFASSEDVKRAPNFYRLFEFVGTPDPYIASKELMDPRRFSMPETARELDALSIYFPPFNFRQQGLRRGRINLNTVNNPLVWRSLMYLHSETGERGDKGAFWDEWMNSRRGNGTAYPLDPRIPTQFAGALRPAESAWIAPRIRSGGGIDERALRFSGNESTIFRKITDGNDERTLFTRPAAGVPARDRDRNAFFRYQTLMRTANLTSDNSNVFAVWATLGFFEVDPDTLQVGQEYGIQQGTNNRPRAFYIIDRSIPVDFKVGEETNSRDTILLERFLK